jgi:hypothetical protein
MTVMTHFGWRIFLCWGYYLKAIFIPRKSVLFGIFSENVLLWSGNAPLTFTVFDA